VRLEQGSHPFVLVGQLTAAEMTFPSKPATSKRPLGMRTLHSVCREDLVDTIWVFSPLALSEPVTTILSCLATYEAPILRLWLVALVVGSVSAGSERMGNVARFGNSSAVSPRRGERSLQTAETCCYSCSCTCPCGHEARAEACMLDADGLVILMTGRTL